LVRLVAGRTFSGIAAMPRRIFEVFRFAGMRLANGMTGLMQSLTGERGRKAMAWNLLFTSDIGLLSLFTIGFILVMGVYIGRYALQHMKSDAKAQNGPEAGAVH
jgi:hypothetical protein